ncbi:hypothetical protein B5J96_2202 [Lactiplantibacillus plantarum]|nr:hypothetical protein B5J96_2202 [Lactiplantibacillus plantarum]
MIIADKQESNKRPLNITKAPKLIRSGSFCDIKIIMPGMGPGKVHRRHL